MASRSAREKPGSSLMELEILELKAKLESQDSLISHYRAQAKGSRSPRSYTSDAAHTAVQKAREMVQLEGKMQNQEVVVKQLRDELVRTYQNMEQVQLRYADAQGSADAKDATITTLRREINNLNDALETSQNERLKTLDSLYNLKVELSAVKTDKTWLERQLEADAVRSCCTNNNAADSRSRMESSRTDQETLQELMSTASHYEEMIRSLDSTYESDTDTARGERRRLAPRTPDGGASPGRGRYAESNVDEKALMEMEHKMGEVEERLKKAVLSQKYSLQVEREQLIEEFKSMQRQLVEHQSHQDMQKEFNASKDVLVQRLKAAKVALTGEVEALKRDLAKCQAENERLLREQRDRNFDANSSRSHMSRLEADLENEKRQRALLTRKLEEINSHSTEEREALSQIKIQVREQSLQTERHQQELGAKDVLIAQLRERLVRAEADMEGLGRENAALQATKVEFERQRDDVNKKLAASAKRLSDLQRLYEDCQEKKTELQGEVQATQREVSLLQSAKEADSDKRGDLENELSFAKKKISKLEAAYESAQKERLELQQNLLPATIKLTQLTHACENYQEQKSTLQEDSLGLHRKISELESRMGRVKEEKAELQRDLRTSENRLNRLEQQHQKTAKDKQELEKKLEVTTRRLQEAVTEKIRGEDARALSPSRLELVSREGEAHEFNKGLMELQAAKLAQEVETQRLKGDFELITNELKACQKEKERLQKELARSQEKLADAARDGDRMQADREKLEHELVAMKGNNSEWKEMCNRIQLDKERLQQELLNTQKNTAR